MMGYNFSNAVRLGLSLFCRTDFLEKTSRRLPLKRIHCVKSARIRSFFDPYFTAFGLNTERYLVTPRIQSECEENMDQKNSEYGDFSLF